MVNSSGYGTASAGIKDARFPDAISVSLQRTDMQFNVYVSYLEIYNEAGYDLLDPSHETKALEELP